MRRILSYPLRIYGAFVELPRMLDICRTHDRLVYMKPAGETVYRWVAL